jgi:hypothetical protein
MFCSKCGAENVNGANFCIKCGGVLTAANESVSSLAAPPTIVTAQTDADRGVFLTADFINSEAFDTLLGNKAAYYRESFLRIYEMKKQDSFDMGQIRIASGFNLWAGFLAPIWLGFRGVYKWAWIYTLLEMLQFSRYTTGVNQLVSFVVNLLIVGYFGNYWYYETLNSKLRQSSDGQVVLAKSMGDGIFFLVASMGAAYAFNTLL